MGESAKALLGGLIFIGLIAAAMLWAIPDIPHTPLVWTFRFAMPAIVVAAALALIGAARRKDVAPDFLRQWFGKPFERDGVCFTILPGAEAGIAHFDIVFQNQYAGACDFRVVVSPPLKSFSFGKRQFDGVALDIACEGGAVGVARIALGIPTKFQGSRTRFDVAAATRYASGRGELLRFKNGLRVGKADTSGLGAAAATAGLLMIGAMHYSKPASIVIAVPTSVAEELPAAQEPKIASIWKPGEPTDDVQQRMQKIMRELSGNAIG